MLRRSLRSKIIKKYSDIVNRRRRNAFLRHTIFDDEDSVEDLLDIHYEHTLKTLASKRYLFRAEKYRNRNSTFNWDDCLLENSLRFNAEEFMKHFRVSRENFWHLVSLLGDNDIFQSKRGRRKKAPVAHHVLVFLYRLGCQGAAGSDIAVGSFFGLGKGTVRMYVRRTMHAILSMKDKYIVWPEGEVRQELKQRIKVSHGFQQCIGIIDGTLIILSSRPEEYGDSYYCRKNCYAINVQVICDDYARITYYYGGWPGSTHDNRVWRNSRIFKNAAEHFNEGEYLIGDSAYSSSSIMVQSFKKNAGEANLNRHKEFFNTKLAGLRVKSEHCIGILKNRFPCLKDMNIVLKGRDSMKEILSLFECCAILHNIFLDNTDDIPQEWYSDLDEGHYWTSDADGTNVENLDVGDRREAVFHAFINDYFI